MTAIILFSAAGILYCAAYLVYCIRRGPAKDAVGAAVLCALSAAALLFCIAG